MAESPRLRRPTYACNSFPHRRHYAVRRKWNRPTVLTRAQSVSEAESGVATEGSDCEAHHRTGASGHHHHHHHPHSHHARSLSQSEQWSPRSMDEDNGEGRIQYADLDTEHEEDYHYSQCDGPRGPLAGRIVTCRVTSRHWSDIDLTDGSTNTVWTTASDSSAPPTGSSYCSSETVDLLDNLSPCTTPESAEAQRTNQSELPEWSLAGEGAVGGRTSPDVVSRSYPPTPRKGLPTIAVLARESLDEFIPVTSPKFGAGGEAGEEDGSIQFLTVPASPVRQRRQPERKSGPGEVVIQNENGERRVLRSTPDWSEEAVNGDHLWVPTSASGDLCYVSDNECSKAGARMKCSACRIVAHVSCIPLVMDKMKLCRFTFWDGDLRQYREHTATLHHWVHRRSQTGKCKQCSKSFQSKLSFSTKEVIAIHCSWCKAAFHNKDTCFSMPRLSEHCSLGVNADIIVPPSWIVKLPGKDNFKSSLRKSPRKKTATRKKAKDKEKEYRAFVVKSIPSTTLKPVLVFINPKSGGNQGAKLMQKFQWLLNPRQVFDLTQGGPKAGLEMFKKVPNLRILACGGDGTAGWVLSVLDQIGINPPPAVGVLPLGTGNDLARALGWGGGYTDEPISKILRNVAEAETVFLDRWKLEVEKNADAQPTEEGKDSLPLNVMNNYFSFGVDAQIALEFHEAREARPQKFNSRLKNKMFYGQAGGKDLLLRKWKDLSEFVTLECDGKDITSKLREQKVHAILFLNIASYAGGTHPWNRAVAEQATDDGVIEVVGLTTYQLPLLQAGGHGTCLARCKTARIVTSKTIPMQVDGEACRLNPSHISISLLNRAPVLAKRRGGKASNTARVVEQLTVAIRKICMADYEQFHYDKEQLQAASVVLGTITVSHDAVLEQVRKLIQPLLDAALGGQTASPGPGSSSPTNGSEEKLPLDWCFIDSCTAERFFRVDSGQEHLHYISDITTDELYVLVDSGTHSCHITDNTLTDGQPSADTLTLMSGTQDLEVEDSLDAAHVKLPSLDSVSPLLEKPSENILKAAKTGDLKKLKDLHNSGFSLLSIDSSGSTALHLSAKNGHRDVVRYLLTATGTSARALLDMMDNESDQTALHKAAYNRRRTIVCLLVTAGANLLLKDKEGRTPRDLALKAEDLELAEYLESQEKFQKDYSEDVTTAV